MSKKLSRRSFLISSSATLLSLAACRTGLTPPGSSEPQASQPDEPEPTPPQPAGEYRATPLAPEAVDPSDRLERSEEEWQALLSPEQYRVVRLKGTERAFTGEYNGFKGDGTYHCVACGNPLFDSAAKFDSGTGWPSFYAPIEEGRVATETDASLMMVRTEALCARCGAHLGHVFEDGPPPTGLRYCMNSVSLNFAPRASAQEGNVIEASNPPAREEPVPENEKTLFDFRGQNEAAR